MYHVIIYFVLLYFGSSALYGCTLACVSTTPSKGDNIVVVSNSSTYVSIPHCFYIAYSTHTCQKKNKFRGKMIYASYFCGTQISNGKSFVVVVVNKFPQNLFAYKFCFRLSRITGILLRLRGRVWKIASYIWNCMGNCIPVSNSRIFLENLLRKPFWTEW